MKITVLLTILSLTCPLATYAQNDEPSSRPPAPPILRALDANGDGVISADEIAGSAAALKTLDANGDGQLTRDELGHPRGDADSGRPHPRMPLIATLDADTNGVISAEEIANAAAALKALDKNGDGQLAQDEIMPGRPHGAFGHPPFPPPIVAALDANGDGVISADEIANAPVALKTLDKNGDGQITREELFPTPPAGFAPEGGRRFGR